MIVLDGNFALGCRHGTDYSYQTHIFQCKLERRNAITNEVLEPITFVLTYPAVDREVLFDVLMEMAKGGTV
jgi:hypothetical protein